MIPLGFTKLHGFCHKFLGRTSQMNITDAVGACAQLDARLPTFRSQEEWMGLVELAYQGTTVWLPSTDLLERACGN